MKRTVSTKDFKSYDWERVWKHIRRSQPGFPMEDSLSHRHNGFLDITQTRYRRVGSDNSNPVYFADNDTFAGKLPALHDTADNTDDDMAFDAEIAELFRPGRTIAEIAEDIVTVCDRYGVAVDEPGFKARLVRRSYVSKPGEPMCPNELTFAGRIILYRDADADRKRRHGAKPTFRQWHLSNDDTEAIAEALGHDPRLVDRFNELNNAHDRPAPASHGKINNHNEPLLNDVVDQVNTLNRHDGTPLNQINDIDLVDNLVLKDGNRRTEWY